MKIPRAAWRKKTREKWRPRSFGLALVREPLHLDQIKLPVKLNDAVDLLDDPLPVVASEMKRLADAHAVELEEPVKDIFEPLGSTVRVPPFVTEEGEEIIAELPAPLRLLALPRNLSVPLGEALGPLLVTLGLHARERVVPVHDTADLGDDSFRQPADHLASSASRSSPFARSGSESPDAAAASNRRPRSAARGRAARSRPCRSHSGRWRPEPRGPGATGPGRQRRGRSGALPTLPLFKRATAFTTSSISSGG